jgi:hypothetical protein
MQTLEVIQQSQSDAQHTHQLVEELVVDIKVM